MSDIGFYHLTRSTLGQALPPLLVRTLAAGQRALILGVSAASLDALSTELWAQPAWLPHGGAADGDPDLQPIWLSTEADGAAPNGAGYLFLVDGAEAETLSAFGRVFDLFNGNDADALSAARLRWRKWRDAGHATTYWQQTERGWQRG